MEGRLSPGSLAHPLCSCDSAAGGLFEEGFMGRTRGWTAAWQLAMPGRVSTAAAVGQSDH